MIHIVFQEADVQILQKSQELDDSLAGEVMEIKDDYAVGPLEDCYSQEGISARRNWWRQVLAGGELEGQADRDIVNDQRTVAALIERLQNDPQEIVWVWAAQNTHDVSGYYWLISQLAGFQGRILILYLNNLPFISEKGTIFYPVNLYQIPPREFLKAKKLARIVTAAEFEMDADEWTRLCIENREVRILEAGKKLIQYGHDLYERELLGFLTANWQKAGRLINQYLNKAKHVTGDAYLLWLLKRMSAAQKIDFQGELKTMRDFEVRLRVTEQAELPFMAQEAEIQK